MKAIIVAAAAWLALISCVPAGAQEVFPARPVQLIVPFPAGGSQDIVNRRLADKFRELWGQPVVVVNRTGANGVVAWQAMLAGKADGYSVLAPAGQGLGYAHLMNSSITHPFLEEFIPVAGYASYPVVFLVAADLPVASMKELGLYANKNPKLLSYGTTGVGSGGHLLFEVFKMLVRVSDDALPAVHYPGIPPELTALAGKQILTAIMPLTSLCAKQIDAGTIRALAVSSSARSTFRREIPTVVEQGFPELAATDHLSYWVPAGTPPAVVAKLADATRAALADPEVKKRIEEMYLEPGFLSGAELRKPFEARLAQFAPIIKKLDLRAQ